MVKKLKNKSWKELQKITKLNLKYKNLTKLPKKINKLNNLSILCLRGNTKLNIDNVIKKLSNLQKLSSLDISYMDLNDFPQSIKQLQTLTKIDLVLKVMLVFGYIMLFRQERWHKHLLIMLIMILMLFSSSMIMIN